MSQLDVSKKGKGFYSRIIISFILILYVFSRVGLNELVLVLQKTDLIYLLVSICITPVLVLVSSWKWQIILRAQGIKIALCRLFWLYLVGYFFNTVLPTNVGGDVVRAWSLGKQTNKPAEQQHGWQRERTHEKGKYQYQTIFQFVLQVFHRHNVTIRTIRNNIRIVRRCCSGR